MTLSEMRLQQIIEENAGGLRKLNGMIGVG
jgi:hypothetical protein